MNVICYLFFLKRLNRKRGHSAAHLPCAGGVTEWEQLKPKLKCLMVVSQVILKWKKNKSQGQKYVTIGTSCQAASKETCPDDFPIHKVSYLSKRTQVKCAFIKPIGDSRETSFWTSSGKKGLALFSTLRTFGAGIKKLSTC